jgi:hypothetical protein
MQCAAVIIGMEISCLITGTYAICNMYVKIEVCEYEKHGRVVY